MALHDDGRGLRSTQKLSVPSVRCAGLFMTGSVKKRLAVAASERPTREENDAEQDMNYVIHLAKHQ